ncbi:hypothetical protein EVG20_g3083 [Dentipellis fragilis]|uniref:CENP-V/GFA domain-containing protein n=1 Tax=Dentipellis fragilis TaxID=205917 RepID=A0A4Y9Z4J2_9AGAM|nr:hypothetical protein EVG20_g3083 [Dentipellis fragilis]
MAVDTVTRHGRKNGDTDASGVQKFTGAENSMAIKIPRATFTYLTGVPRKHAADNGSGTLVTREFCAECGSGIMEYGVRLMRSWLAAQEHAGEYTYIFHGSLDDPTVLPPKAEFFLKYKAPWQPEIPNITHKQEHKA